MPLGEIKSRLNENKWWNMFPKNPTQTSYLRFKRSPSAAMESMFSRSKEKFGSKLKSSFDGEKL